MSDDYLPARATTTEACEWLAKHAGGRWVLARLLECGLIPWFWLDYSPGWPHAIFGGRVEGYLAPIVFVGDTDRLAADGREALVTITRTYDGELLKIGPPALRVPLDDLRFLRDDIKQLGLATASDRFLSQKKSESAVEPSDSMVNCASQQAGRPDTNSCSPEWEPRKPKRVADPLTSMIYDVLREACLAGQPCPRARDMMDRLSEKKPPDFVQVVGNSITFLNAKGDLETADIDAVRNRIKRMTEPKDDR